MQPGLSGTSALELSCWWEGARETGASSGPAMQPGNPLGCTETHRHAHHPRLRGHAGRTQRPTQTHRRRQAEGPRWPHTHTHTPLYHSSHTGPVHTSPHAHGLIAPPAPQTRPKALSRHCLRRPHPKWSTQEAPHQPPCPLVQTEQKVPSRGMCNGQGKCTHYIRHGGNGSPGAVQCTTLTAVLCSPGEASHQSDHTRGTLTPQPMATHSDKDYPTGA